MCSGVMLVGITILVPRYTILFCVAISSRYGSIPGWTKKHVPCPLAIRWGQCSAVSGTSHLCVSTFWWSVHIRHTQTQSLDIIQPLLEPVLLFLLVDEIWWFVFCGGAARDKVSLMYMRAPCLYSTLMEYFCSRSLILRILFLEIRIGLEKIAVSGLWSDCTRTPSFPSMWCSKCSAVNTIAKHSFSIWV